MSEVSAKLPRTADVVLHKPSGEHWVVAYVEDDGRYLAACGWPFALVPTDQFEVTEHATDEESEKLLQELAVMSAHDDLRARWARRKLRERVRGAGA